MEERKGQARKRHEVRKINRLCKELSLGSLQENSLEFSWQFLNLDCFRFASQ